ncbi:MULTISPECIES: hypothetical protein [Selenomonas]|uniref:Flagellar protein n=1 Tax=Selenomonas ruminis TaxID=2593411 RepID=A0A5D6W9Z5_9FIRM|nr:MULTISPECIES: hypothetical protein [unclassified Selenomonas]MBQ1868702.1 hypothetical protein [Selenomonas sp.]TYZ24726.1 hypothetical protein FZ040_01400 [Selenomonas sp. mPRGC5]
MNKKYKPHLHNCPLCGRLFMDTGLGSCPKCYEETRETEKRVIEYVRKYPHSTVKEICNDTGTDVKLVTQMVQRGQFYTDGLQYLYPCSRCGKPIHHGVYCSKCLGRLNKAIKEYNDRANERKTVAEDEKKKSRRPRLHWMESTEK